MIQFIFFILFLSLNSFSEELDDFWQITDYEDPDRIWVTVNGQITHGDKTRISLSPKDDSCNLAVTYTTFYTTVDDGAAKFSKLPSKYMVAEIFGGPVLYEIISTNDFLAGNIAWFFTGSLPLKELKEFFKNKDSFSVELKHFFKEGKEGGVLDIDVEEYFDVPKNSWSLNNFEEALDEAQKECLKRL